MFLNVIKIDDTKTLHPPRYSKIFEMYVFQQLLTPAIKARFSMRSIRTTQYYLMRASEDNFIDA